MGEFFAPIILIIVSKRHNRNKNYFVKNLKKSYFGIFGIFLKFRIIFLFGACGRLVIYLGATHARPALFIIPIQTYNGASNTFEAVPRGVVVWSLVMSSLLFVGNPQYNISIFFSVNSISVKSFHIILSNTWTNSSFASYNMEDYLVYGKNLVEVSIVETSSGSVELFNINTYFTQTRISQTSLTSDLKINIVTTYNNTDPNSQVLTQISIATYGFKFGTNTVANQYDIKLFINNVVFSNYTYVYED